MKHLYLIAVISFLLFNCSSDNDVTPGEDTSIPIIESISQNTIKAGEVLTIQGKNFDINKTYTVTFNEVEGKITEVNTAFIKVEVPENATSGKIQLRYDGKTIDVGDIEIEILESKLYAYKREGGQSIVEINSDTGTETTTVATLGDDYYDALVFNRVTNEIIGKYRLGGSIDPDTGETTPLQVFLYKINITTGDTTTSEMASDYESFVISSEGRLYAYKRENPQSIVEINTNNGTEVSTIATLSEHYYSNLVFNEDTNEIIAKYVTPAVIDPDTGTEVPSQIYLHKIKISAGSLEVLDLAFDYERFIKGQNGKLYAYKREQNSQSIVEIDTNNGAEIATIATLGNEYYANLVYNKATNEIIGKYRTGGVVSPDTSGEPLKAFLYKINISTGETTTSELVSDYESFVIFNE